jgi:large subunit ribosomal protein L1
MTVHGKRYEAAVKVMERERLYEPREALAKIKEMATAKFDETVDVVIRLGVDPRHGEQMVRGTVLLPHGTGRTVRVAAIAKGEAAAAAEQAGADVVGAEDLIQKIDEGWRDFDILVSTRDMMKLVGRLGKKLGPRMPNPKAGTLGDDLGRIVRELKAGKSEFRMDKAGILHQAIGKSSFDLDKLAGNFVAFMEAVLRARPAAARGTYIRRVFVSSTMGPSVPVDPAAAQQVETEE